MNAGHGEKLSRKREDAICALLSSGTVKEAAERTGVDPKTLMAWMREPGFNGAYQEARTAIVSQATARLRSRMSEAVDVLAEVMNEAANPPGPRISAAKTVLEMGLKAVENEEIIDRLSALEEHVKNKGKRP